MRDNFIIKKDFTGLSFGFQGVKFITVQDSALSWSPASMSSKSEGHSVLCNSLPRWTIHGVLQATILEWVAIPFSRDLPNPGIKPRHPASQADSLPSEPPGKLVKTHHTGMSYIKVKEYGQILSLMKLKFLVLGQTLKFPKIIVTLKKKRQKLPELMLGGLTLVCGNQRGLP